MNVEEITLTLLILLAALLYSSVGHAGASGYMAAMALFGLPADVMRPTALALNVLVATIASYRYTQSGQNDWKLLLPFVIASTPSAFIGGLMPVSDIVYKPLVGVILLLSAIQLAMTAQKSAIVDNSTKRPSIGMALFTGSAIGLLAGLSGTGGGIFLSPLLLFMKWAPTRTVSGVSACFILVNSLAGLVGAHFSASTLPLAFPYWAGAAVLGGVLGTYLGKKKLSIPAIRYLLAAVLLVAGGKMILV